MNTSHVRLFIFLNIYMQVYFLFLYVCVFCSVLFCLLFDGGRDFYLYF